MGTLIVNGRYEVMAELGRGGMGVVYRAVQRSLNRTVAIKMLSRELAGDTEFRQRFQQEAQAIARLQHSNIVSVYDIEADRGTFFIIMEYVEGRSLQEVLRTGGRLEPRQAAHLIGQVARALGYAHSKGIIHRDIKPDNIMILGESIGEQKAMVMDFGIARVADSTLKTQTGISMGTPKYMSPEQARGQHVDARSDLYSLGVVLYACVTGELPFDGDSPFTIALKHMQEAPTPPSEKIADLPPALEHIILRAMAKEREARFQSGEEFAAALDAICNQTPAISAASEPKEAMPGAALLGPTEATTLQQTPAAPAGTPPTASKVIEDPFEQASSASQATVDFPARGAKAKTRMRWVWGGAAGAVILCGVVFAIFHFSGGQGQQGQSNPVMKTEVKATPAAPRAISAAVHASPVPSPVPAPQRKPAPPPEDPWQENGQIAFQTVMNVWDTYKQALANAHGKPLEQSFVDAQAKELTKAIKILSHLTARRREHPAMADELQGPTPMINAINMRLASMRHNLMQTSRPEAERLYQRVEQLIPEEQEFMKTLRTIEPPAPPSRPVMQRLREMRPVNGGSGR